jgi:hypothetical protein
MRVTNGAGPPAIGVEIYEPGGKRRLSFAVSLVDLHRALLMAS